MLLFLPFFLWQFTCKIISKFISVDLIALVHPLILISKVDDSDTFIAKFKWK